ncbi:MAG: toxic anion resistance protein [Pseudomonadota bacterium]
MNTTPQQNPAVAAEEAAPAAVTAVVAEAEAVVAAPTRELKTELVPIDMAEGDERAAIETRMQEIDITDTNSIIKFGSGAQQDLTAISDQMLEGVRNKDTGPAGSSLASMVTTIRGFDIDELDPNRSLSWWEKLLGKAKPVAQFMAQYETVRGQIDSITDELLRHETVLLKDVKFLDKLYDSTLEFYDDLGLYIAAGEAKLNELDVFVIPEKEKQVAAAAEGEGVMEAQELRDLRSARDELERRVHDMKLTRQVTMQSLPSIRLVQENDKSLINKINSTLVNTVPLWRTQLAQAVTVARSRDAAKVVKEATDLTNELLTKNAENLQQANREVRTQMERGVFDIETIKAANKTLIDTIEESLKIADEGKAKRAAAEQDLQTMESELKATLAAARARASGAPAPAETETPSA